MYRDGDIYAALRDCHSALRLDPKHRKAHFRLARCLLQLTWSSEAHQCLQSFKTKFPEYAKYSECQALERDITSAVFSSSDKRTNGKTRYSRTVPHILCHFVVDI